MKMKVLMQEFVGLFGYGLHNTSPKARIFAKDNRFLELYESFRSNTLVSVERCFALYQLAMATRHVEGNVAEFGVYKGGTAKMLAEVYKGTKKNIFLFDTFDGMPDDANKGLFSDVSLEQVKEYLSAYPEIKYYPGFFPESARGVEGKFCLVYLDADLGKSTQDGLEFFYDKLSFGGVIVVDDYGQERWPDVKIVVDAFAKKVGIYPVAAAPFQCFLMKNR